MKIFALIGAVLHYTLQLSTWFQLMIFYCSDNPGQTGYELKVLSQVIYPGYPAVPILAKLDTKLMYKVSIQAKLDSSSCTKVPILAKLDTNSFTMVPIQAKLGSNSCTTCLSRQNWIARHVIGIGLIKAKLVTNSCTTTPILAKLDTNPFTIVPKQV